MGSISIRFYAELGDFLPVERRGREFEHVCPGRDSVKDVIEGLGVPHTEVDLVLVNGEPVGFDHHLSEGDRVSVYPVFEALDISAVKSVRSQPLRVVRFAADVHLGRLARYLRLAGFDTLYRNDWDDRELAETAVREHRIILTRDRGLLMRSIVTHGYVVRETLPRAQLVEVLGRFDLWGLLRPFTRCSVCNDCVEPVTKAEIVSELPARTARYYQEFWRCTGCGRLYWRGPHYRSLMKLFSPDAGPSDFRRLSDPRLTELPPGEQRHSDECEYSHGDDTP
ncbi:MAG: Mut7-C ubiquitin/RNAse domain-containing protein [Actinobacteria bacterium]|nr:Mut7-C ubiquitin/RNAse domain-containing protein [Actinomycetota bacterium]